MGRDMLAQDYILKQITASLIYPEKDLGKAFWDAVYTKARQMYGTTQIPVNTFNKVWIVADKADVFEKGNVAYIVGAHLKVMLEEDYLALTKYRSQPGDTFRSRCPHAGCQATQGLSVKASQGNHHIASEVIRQIILPQIEHEVNAGQNFAPLRQMFYSMILASWYKMALKDAILTQIYGNKSKVKVGINQADPKVNEEIFQRYLKAYKKGVFNYIKEDIDQTSQQSMPKKYFSGGEKVWASLDHAQIVNSIPADVLGPTGTMEEVIAMVNVRNGQYTDMRGLKRRDVLKFERRKALREARKIFFNGRSVKEMEEKEELNLQRSWGLSFLNQFESQEDTKPLDLEFKAEVLAEVNARNGQYTNMKGLHRRTIWRIETRKARREIRKIASSQENGDQNAAMTAVKLAEIDNAPLVKWEGAYWLWPFNDEYVALQEPIPVAGAMDVISKIIERIEKQASKHNSQEAVDEFLIETNDVPLQAGTFDSLGVLRKLLADGYLKMKEGSSREVFLGDKTNLDEYFVPRQFSTMSPTVAIHMIGVVKPILKAALAQRTYFINLFNYKDLGDKDVVKGIINLTKIYYQGRQRREFSSRDVHDDRQGDIYRIENADPGKVLREAVWSEASLFRMRADIEIGSESGNVQMLKPSDPPFLVRGKFTEVRVASHFDVDRFSVANVGAKEQLLSRKPQDQGTRIGVNECPNNRLTKDYFNGTRTSLLFETTLKPNNGGVEIKNLSPDQTLYIEVDREIPLEVQDRDVAALKEQQKIDERILGVMVANIRQLPKLLDGNRFVLEVYNNNQVELKRAEAIVAQLEGVEYKAIKVNGKKRGIWLSPLGDLSEGQKRKSLLEQVAKLRKSLGISAAMTIASRAMIVERVRTFLASIDAEEYPQMNQERVEVLAGLMKDLDLVFKTYPSSEFNKRASLFPTGNRSFNGYIKISYKDDETIHEVTEEDFVDFLMNKSNFKDKGFANDIFRKCIESLRLFEARERLQGTGDDIVRWKTVEAIGRELAGMELYSEALSYADRVIDIARERYRGFFRQSRQGDSSKAEHIKFGFWSLKRDEFRILILSPSKLPILIADLFVKDRVTARLLVAELLALTPDHWNKREAILSQGSNAMLTPDAALIANPTSEEISSEDWVVLENIAKRVLWLATKMIDEANKNKDKMKVKIGGHPAATASALQIITTLELLIKTAHDHVAHKPHSSPAYYAVKYLLGEITKDQMYYLRETLDPDHQGLSAYPTVSDGVGVTIPTGSVGLGPAATIALALTEKMLKGHGFKVPDSHFFAVLGDAEFDEGNLKEIIPYVQQYRLKNVTHIVDYNRQSLDGDTDGAKLNLIKNTYAASGWKVVELKWGSKILKAFKSGREGASTFQHLMDNMDQNTYQGLLSRNGGYIREHLLAARPIKALRSFLARYTDDELYELFTDLGGHDLVLLNKAKEAAKKDKEPVVIIAHTIKGWGLKPMVGRPKNHSQLLETDEMEALRRELKVPGEEAFPAFAPDSAEGKLLKKIKDRLNGQQGEYEKLKEENEAAFKDEFDPHFFPKRIDPKTSFPITSTQEYMGYILQYMRSMAHKPDEGLTKEQLSLKAIAKRLFSVSPDVSTSTSLGVTEADIYNDKNPKGTHLRFGIAEQAAITQAVAMGKSREFNGIPIFPVVSVYEPFFFKRGLDPAFYGEVWGSRFIGLLTPSGSALHPEGEKHQGQVEPVIAKDLPNSIIWEPSSDIELEYIMANTLKRMAMQDDDGRNAVFIRESTTRLKSKQLLERLRYHESYKGKSDEEILDLWSQDMLKGGYRLVDYRGYEGYHPDDNVVNIFTTGVSVQEALAASDKLLEQGIYANVIVISSPTLLIGNLGAKNGYEHLHKLVPDEQDMTKNERIWVPTISVADASPSYLDGIAAILGLPLGVKVLGVRDNGASTRELEYIFDKHDISRGNIEDYAVKLLYQRDTEQGHSRKLYQLAGLTDADLGLKRLGSGGGNPAMMTSTMEAPGGISFDRAQMQMNIRKEGQGVQMKFDPAMVARIRRNGFEGVDFEIESIIPIVNLPQFLGV